MNGARVREELTSLCRIALGMVAATALVAGPAGAADKPDRLVIMSHAVHQKVTTGEKGGDSTADWRARHGVEVEWLTFGVQEVHERAFREASLREGTASIVFMLARYGGPRIANLFEDLNAYQAREPIEDFDDISAGMRAAHTHGGKLVGIPFRHATHGLHYNRAYFTERGLAEPPKTLEELVSYAEKLTYKRADGTQVHGFITSSEDPSGVLDLIRGFGGDFITSDYQVVSDHPGTIKAVSLLRDWFAKGVLPKNFASLATEDVTTMMQQGRAAMTTQPFGRFRNYNNKEQSKFPGQIAVTTIPMAAAAGGGLVPAKTSVWAMGIPVNAKHKDLAWDLIKTLSSKEATLREAINGNGPVRVSTYDDPGVRERVSYAAAEQAVLQQARLILPPFADASKAMDIFMEELESAVLGLKDPGKAMTDAKKRVQPLLPKS